MQLSKRTVKGKVKNIGEVIDGKYLKEIQYSKHFFRKAKAFGIDADILPVLLEKQVTQIVLNDMESGKRYVADMTAFMEKKWLHKFDKFQDQLFLALPYWTVTDRWGIVEQRAKKVKVEVEPMSDQPSLL